MSSLNVSYRDVAAQMVEHRFNINPQATREFFMAPRLRGNAKLTQPYRQHGLTYAASRAIATNIAQVPFLIHVGQDENDEDVIRDGPWVELFDQPNPVTTQRAIFWESTILMLLDRGECFWVKEGPGDNKIGPMDIPTELWPINGKLFEPFVDPDTRLPIAWLYKPPGIAKPIVYLPHELVIHRMTDPYQPLRGIGAYEAGELAYTQDYKAARYNEAFFDNDATPGGLLLTEGRLTEIQRNAIREAWEERHQGSSRRRRVAMLEGGLKYEETGSTHREMEFEKGRAFSWKELLAVLGTPEYEVGLTQNINMATAQMISKDFVTKRLVPLMRMLEDGMWSQLFKPVEGGQRALNFSESRMTRRKRHASRMNYPAAMQSLQRGRVAYELHRHVEKKRVVTPDGVRVDYSPEIVNPQTSLWGEFDLTSIEALREDYGAKLAQAAIAQGMGVPFNQINERLDLGFEQIEGDAGETSFILNTLTPVDLKLNPPAPMAPGAPPGKPGAGKPKPSTGSSKPNAGPDAGSKDGDSDGGNSSSTLAQEEVELRLKVETFFARRPVQREQLWMAHIRMTKPIEEKFRSKYKRWLNDLRADLLKKLEGPTRGPSELDKSRIEQLLFDEKGAKQKLLTLAHGVYVEASRAGIESAMTALGGNFAFDVVDPKVVDAIEQRELILAKSTATLRARVKRSLEKGVDNGETLHQLQDRLRADFNSFSGPRSLMIARTEVAGATNTARDLAFREEGVDSTQWITARDEAVRDSHAEIDGDTAETGEPFDNGLLYPGDPSGDAGEVINCRCVAIPVV